MVLASLYLTRNMCYRFFSLHQAKSLLDVREAQLKEEGKYVHEMNKWIANSDKMMAAVQRKLETNETHFESMVFESSRSSSDTTSDSSSFNVSHMSHSSSKYSISRIAKELMDIKQMLKKKKYREADYSMFDPVPPTVRAPPRAVDYLAGIPSNSTDLHYIA